MWTKLLTTSLFLFSLTSCKKDYVCECTDLNEHDTFKINDTKKKAEQQCADRIYYTGDCKLQ